jgi:hypothetical protein
MKWTIVGLFVSLATAGVSHAQAPEQIPNHQALYERGDAMDAIGTRKARVSDGVDERREGVELQHKGVIDKQRALDVDPAVYQQDDALLRRAVRSR